MLQYRYNKNKLSSISLLCLLVLNFLLSVNTTNAATLSVIPSSPKVSVGNMVSVKILVNTQGKSINNIESLVIFPKDLLEVISTSKTPSIFSLWVEDPSFSNIEGKVVFNGGLPNPGYVGQNGEVLSITFKAKKQGNASIVFSDSAIRQNDGLGTDILSSTQFTTIEIVPASLIDIPIVNPASNNLPVKPVIISSTNPDQEAWYKNTSASFSWSITDDVVSVQTLLSKSANSTPTVTYDSSVSQRTVNNISDGISYFHLRYSNSSGWGPTAHYKIQIDSTPPEKFSLNVKKQGIDNIVTLNAKDKVSGIDSYLLKIDDGQPIRISNNSLVNNEYVLPVQNKGDHEVYVSAYDKAGNYTDSKATFSSEEIVAPVLEVYPETVTKNQSVEIKGVTKYPKSNVRVYISNEKAEPDIYSVVTSDDGSFNVKSNNFKKIGLVHIWSQIEFSDKVKSPVSEKISLNVNDTTFTKTTKSITYGLFSIIVIIALLSTLIFVSYMGWYKFFGLKKKISRELSNTEADIHKVLTVFKEELDKQLSILEKVKEDRSLNKKEEKVFKDLKDNIDNIDEFIDKKLKKIK